MIERNIKDITERVNRGAYLMVKADAYGHGLERVATATEKLVKGFGVASIEEGVALRRAGISKEILLLVCGQSELKEAFKSGLSVGIHNFGQLDELERLIAQSELRAEDARVHIKVDTGMHRLGFSPDNMPSVTAALKRMGVIPIGVYSHLRARNYSQKMEFIRSIGMIKPTFPQITAHLAASANLSVRTLEFDAVRIGIAAYKGAMTVKSEVIETRRVEAGEYIGYGNFKAPYEMDTAIVFGGYADGVCRERPSSVVINGKQCKPLGRVCMDMFIVDASGADARVGDEVTLLSPELSDKVARERHTIPYAVMTGWRGRIERIYVDKGASEEDRH